VVCWIMQWSFGWAALGYGGVLSFVLLCSVKCHVEVLCWIIWWQVGLLGNGCVLICSIRLCDDLCIVILGHQIVQ